jgi:hypothetical protein
MEDVEFSDEFCRFIQTTVPAVDAAELLLLLRGKPEVSFSAEEAVAKLGPGITISDAARYLEVFQSKGLVQGTDKKYRYLASSVLAAKVDLLHQAYEQRPVTLIRVIYALRDSKIQNFADAFRIRKP